MQCFNWVSNSFDFQYQTKLESFLNACMKSLWLYSAFRIPTYQLRISLPQLPLPLPNRSLTGSLRLPPLPSSLPFPPLCSTLPRHKTNLELSLNASSYHSGYITGTGTSILWIQEHYWPIKTPFSIQLHHCHPLILIATQPPPHCPHLHGYKTNLEFSLNASIISLWLYSGYRNLTGQFRLPSSSSSTVAPDTWLVARAAMMRASYNLSLLRLSLSSFSSSSVGRAANLIFLSWIQKLRQHRLEWIDVICRGKKTGIPGCWASFCQQKRVERVVYEVVCILASQESGPGLIPGGATIAEYSLENKQKVRIWLVQPIDHFRIVSIRPGWAHS